MLLLICYIGDSDGFVGVVWCCCCLVLPLALRPYGWCPDAVMFLFLAIVCYVCRRLCCCWVVVVGCCWLLLLLVLFCSASLYAAVCFVVLLAGVVACLRVSVCSWFCSFLLLSCFVFFVLFMSLLSVCFSF